ncbi:uncharacterized protein LOC120131266 [Hibiscus syriacus]|uniref:uncharacterized protein LOC120131266 n=1 Tax=Hibiscus syriacus TaxID=106335 RepID=UPI0019250167|nr:uncharacterized protein LOC120131266 [Hibiscus syriacus]
METPGQLQLVDLENNYYLVKFEDERDYADVLTDGSWTISGNYLMIQPWSRSFSTTEKHPSHVIVWIRLPGLPYRYYCKALFRRTAMIVGKVIKVDYNTLAGERGRFARIPVMVDLNKPQKPCIGIDNFVQKIEYEGLYQICFSCGIYGHSKEIVLPQTWRRRIKIIQETRNKPPPQNDVTQDRFGPWMVVPSRRRKANTKNPASNSGGNTDDQTKGSRFEILRDEQTEKTW